MLFSTMKKVYLMEKNTETYEVVPYGTKFAFIYQIFINYSIKASTL